MGVDESTAYFCCFCCFCCADTEFLAVSAVPSLLSPTTPPPTIEGPVPLESYHTHYKAVLDTFENWVSDWTKSNLDGRGKHLHTSGISNPLSVCGTLTKWEFEDLTVDAKNQ